MTINFEELLQQQRDTYFATKIELGQQIKQTCIDSFTIEFEKVLLSQYLRNDWEVNFLLPNNMFDTKYYSKEDMITLCKESLEDLPSLSGFNIAKVSFAYQGVYKEFKPILVIQVVKK